MKVSDRVDLPSEFRQRLLGYRHRVWRVKLIEGLGVAWAMLLASFLVVFLVDRVGDTPHWLRALALVAGVSGFVLLLPAKLYRWVWRSRSLKQVAGVLRLKHARLGERLLGAVELAAGTAGSFASPALCRAAILQMAEDTRPFDFATAVPDARHRQWSTRALAVSVLAGVAFFTTAAGPNALARWALPWGGTARYTFAQLDDLPDSLVVARGEPFTLALSLREDSPWRPAVARARYGSQQPLEAPLATDAYRFEFPSQTVASSVEIDVGDAHLLLDVRPLPRPELLALGAQVGLPAYLERAPMSRDARTGRLTVLTGSRVALEARASRALAEASLDGDTVAVEMDGGVGQSTDSFQTPAVEVSGSRTLTLSWVDVEGLSAQEPFLVHLATREDDAPVLSVTKLLREQVVLENEVVSFGVKVHDDFGVRRVGFDWSGVPKTEAPTAETLLHGEAVLAVGGPEVAVLEVRGAFHAKGLGIPPQPIHLRVWAEDYLPDRGRVYSSTFRFYVLSAEEHMIWVTGELKKWERRLLEVKDEEERLFETNQELNALDVAALAQPERRRQLEQQAAAERANAARLRGLTRSGDELISEAARNDQFNAATLERWARTLQVLKDLANSRMPSVAGRLARAAAQAKSAAGKSNPGEPAEPKKSAPSVGETLAQEGASGGGPKSSKKSPSLPSIKDMVEGPGREPTDGSEPPPPSQSKSSGGRLGLPTTTLGGGAPTPPPPPQAAPEGREQDNLDQAVEEQAKLLAEFRSVMDDLAEVLKQLYGSTFVKRLKHAAGLEKKLAKRLEDQLEESFGKTAAELAERDIKELAQLSGTQDETALQVRHIQDDLGAFFERTEEPKFDKVRKEMKETRVVVGLRDMSDALEEPRQGETIALAEYWVDHLDRWAEILVGPG